MLIPWLKKTLKTKTGLLQDVLSNVLEFFFSFFHIREQIGNPPVFNFQDRAENGKMENLRTVIAYFARNVLSNAFLPQLPIS